MTLASKPYQKLYRSSNNRIIAGVCGGLANYFGMAPGLMRFLFILFLLFGGSGFFIYIIMWLIVPLDYANRAAVITIQPERYKKLYRSAHERMIAGVCGGLANYFGLDPTWIRLLFIFFFLFGGAAFFIYIIMWLLLPLDYPPMNH